MELSLHQKLARVQQELNAPKNQHNKFGGYKYRSCEDILQAVKPLLGDLILTITDEIVPVADRIYVKATATITDGKERIETTAYAREELTKKGMDASQITGSTSSYARKYALNGLLLIDDSKDADTQDNRESSASRQQAPEKPALTPGSRFWTSAKAAYLRDGSLNKVKAHMTITPEHEKQLIAEAEHDKQPAAEVA